MGDKNPKKREKKRTPPPEMIPIFHQPAGHRPKSRYKERRGKQNFASLPYAWQKSLINAAISSGISIGMV